MSVAWVKPQCSGDVSEALGVSKAASSGAGASRGAPLVPR